MSRKRMEWKVGLFVFIGLVLVGGLMLQFSKGMSLFRPTWDLLLTTRNVGGLKPTSYVLMSGVQIGTVSRVELSPEGTNVTITLRIYKQYRIHKDARFIIQQSGILGDQYVAVEPTENADGLFDQEHPEHATAIEPFNLQEVARSAVTFIQRVDATVQRLDDSIADLRRFLLNENTLTNFAGAVVRMRIATERAITMVDNVDTLVSTNAAAISVSASNLVSFSRELSEFADTLNDLVATNTAGVSASVSNIQSSTVMLHNILEDAHSGKGLAGTLLHNEQVANDMTAILKNLSVTTSNLNRSGLWGILWAKKPPKTNAPPAKSAPPPKRVYN